MIVLLIDIFIVSDESSELEVPNRRAVSQGNVTSSSDQPQVDKARLLEAELETSPFQRRAMKLFAALHVVSALAPRGCLLQNIGWSLLYYTAGVAATCRVVDYGAACDGRSDDTLAVQRALDACANYSGVVELPTDGSNRTCLTFPLDFHNGTQLHVPAGATLKAFPSVSRWPNATRFNFVELKRRRDVSVFGAGTIDGSGEVWYTVPLAVLNGERIDYWLGVGAQPSEKVKALIKKYGTNGTRLEEQKVALATLAESRRRPEPPMVKPAEASAEESTEAEAPATEAPAEPVEEAPAEEEKSE